MPGGVGQSNNPMPVMIFIHGGGYSYGSRLELIPTPLAVHGDVIVATINYRLGVLGFLYDGPGMFIIVLCLMMVDVVVLSSISWSHISYLIRIEFEILFSIHAEHDTNESSCRRSKPDSLLLK